MRLVGLMITCIPMCVFTGAALRCLDHGHTGFAVVFTVFAFLSVPAISIGKGGAK